MRVLEPLWQAKPETASRIRGRIENVLDWAKTRGFRTGENPARWRGHLENLLPAPSKAKAAKRRQNGQDEHLAALPYRDVPALLACLRSLEGIIPARALEFAILTCARTNEVLGATWSEIDLAAKTWIVPAQRMKSGREHRVPLSDAAVATLVTEDDTRRHKDGHIFPGAEPGGRLPNHVLYNFLKGRLGCAATVHGFRSSFSDWATERTSASREERELALAHNVGDATERAYRRTDMFARRRRLMERWAEFCDGGEAGEVIPLIANRG
jgi:integrase